MISRERMGDLYLILAVLAWANNYALGKLVLTVLPPMFYAASRFGIAAALLMLILLLRGQLKLPERRDLPGLILLGMIGVSIMHTAWTYGLKISTVTNASILLATAPIFTNIFTSLRGQKIGLGAWLGVALSFCGAFLVINNSFSVITLGGGTLTGDLLLLASAMCWALYNALSPPYIQRIGALNLTAWSTLSGAALLSPFLLIELPEVHFAAITPAIAGCFVFATVFAAALGTLWWYEGIERLGISRAVVYHYLVPVVAIGTAGILLGEEPSLPQMAGGVTVLAGIAITRRLSAPDAAGRA